MMRRSKKLKRRSRVSIKSGKRKAQVENTTARAKKKKARGEY